MDNTKKQPMSDKELAKISGGNGFKSDPYKSKNECPFCGYILKGKDYDTHYYICPNNPKNM